MVVIQDPLLMVASVRVGLFVTKGPIVYADVIQGMDTYVHIIEGSIQQSSLFLFEHYLLEYVKKE